MVCENNNANPKTCLQVISWLCQTNNLAAASCLLTVFERIPDRILPDSGAALVGVGQGVADKISRVWNNHRPWGSGENIDQLWGVSRGNNLGEVSPRNNRVQLQLSQNNQGEEQSMNELANSLHVNSTNFEKERWASGLPERFDTHNYSAVEFAQLAIEPSQDAATPQSIAEAKSIYQAKIEEIVINPRRPDRELAERVNLDF